MVSLLLSINLPTAHGQPAHLLKVILPTNSRSACPPGQGQHSHFFKGRPAHLLVSLFRSS
jgi:hypothetical protein